ncbi:MAG: STAS domain-containing protein [Spirochaetota bacterium]
MMFSVRRISRYSIAKVNPPMDMTTSYNLKHQLLELSEEEGQSLVVDLNDIDELDSSAISLLVTLQKKLNSKGLGFYMIHVNRRIKGLFNLAFLKDFFKIYPTEEDLP